MTTPDEVLRFWIQDVGADRWFDGGDKVDAACRKYFASTVEAAQAGGLREWMISPRGTLAYLIVTDQMPRNIFRGDARAFASDLRARESAHIAINRGWDLATADELRHFFYLPFEHSESIPDQQISVALMMSRLGDAALLLHARAHREVIRRFSRFPGRNAALGRDSRPGEVAFQAAGGYGALVRAMQAAHAGS